MRPKETVIRRLECLRCGHEWFPNKVGLPRACPACHSPYWDRHRTLIIKKKSVRRKETLKVNITSLRERLGIKELKSELKITKDEESRIRAIRMKEHERANVA